MIATKMKKRKPEICMCGNQSKIPKTEPIAPKTAPKTAAIIPTTAPIAPAISPNNPPIIPIQNGKVMMSKITTSTEEFDEDLAVIINWLFMA